MLDFVAYKTQCFTAGRYSNCVRSAPDSKIHGAKIGPIWGRQDPGGPHVGPMNLAIWGDHQHWYFLEFLPFEHKYYKRSPRIKNRFMHVMLQGNGLEWSQDLPINTVHRSLSAKYVAFQRSFMSYWIVLSPSNGITQGHQITKYQKIELATCEIFLSCFPSQELRTHIIWGDCTMLVILHNNNYVHGHKYELSV